MFVFSDAPTLMSLPQMRNLRFQFDLHPDKACLISPVQGIKNVIPQVAPSSHLVLDLLELSQYMWQVRFGKHKKSGFPTCFSHSEYGFHQKTRGRSSLEEAPKNLVFATDDEWLIDEINMELIRVHKKTRKVKYDPKEGQMPVPLELLDTTCKTIMQFAKNRVVTQEDDWRVTERPLTMQQMKRLFMTEASFKATSTAEANNEKAFENLAEASEKLGLEGTEEYKAFVRDHYRIERSSLMRLADQQYGYGQSGLYHDGVRVDEVGSFKLQHMRWRQTASRHPQHKFHLSEEDLKMDPVYSRRPERKDIVFRAGDVRSTLDDRQMAKASKAREETLEVNQALPERVRELSQANRAATRDELVNAKLHYFLAAGVDEQEIGDLSLDKMPNPILHRFGLAEDGRVPVYASKTKYTALVLNLGSLARNRNRSNYADFIDYDDSGVRAGLLIKSHRSGPGPHIHVVRGRRNQ